MAYNIHPEKGMINRGNWYRIKECMKKAAKGEAITVGFLGGSITQGCLSSTPETCYAYLVYEWWKGKFPQSEIAFINAGIGGTTSQFGVARVDDHLLKYDPDFVLIEFAVNDDNTEFFEETYEGLVRRTLSDKCDPAVMLMNNVKYDDGLNAEEMHLKVAKAYELPMVSMKSTIWPEVEAGRIPNREITPDDLHPNDEGHKLVAQVIITFLEQVYEDMETEEMPSDFGGNVLPAPITANAYENSVRYQNDNSTPQVSGFEADSEPQKDIREIFRKGWTAWKEGDKISFTINCSGVAVQYRKSVKQPTPVAKVVVDGKEEEAVILDGNFKEDWGDCLYIDTVTRHMKPCRHKVEITIIEAHEDDVVPFYLVSVIGSNEKKTEKRKPGKRNLKEKKEGGKSPVSLKSLGEYMKGAEGSKRSIMQTLLAGFLIPVIMMIVLGTVSYNMASSGILTKYKESAMSTVAAVGNYCNLVCDSISSKALELITNSDVGDYYDKYYKKQDSKGMESFRSAKSIISNTKSTNKYIFSCSVIPENGSYISTITGSMSENIYEDFQNTVEGQYFVENPNQKNKWLGYHTYLDEYLNSDPEKYAMTFYQKTMKSGSMLVMDIEMETAMEILDQMDFGNNSIRALISPDGREVISIKGKEGEPVEETYFVGNDFYEETKASEETGSMDVKMNGKKYVYIYTPVGKTGAMICALIPRSNLLGQVGTIKYITIIMVILAAGAALAIGMMISMGISKTVKSMTSGLSKVAEGDLTNDFSTKRQDEFKILTSGLNSMMESMRTLMQDMKQFGTKVSALSVDVSEKTEAVSTSMDDISRAMDEVAKGVQNQAEDTENSNEKMLSLSENINDVTEKTSGMGSAADKAIDAVEKGKIIVQNLSDKSDTTVSLTQILVKDIDEVQRSSEEIKNFVDVISSIAGQTNLLSLNASIEAARAGEAGKGFAVVAEEIRKLADQSKESGNKIRDIVEMIGNTTDKTTASAKEAVDMVNEQAKALAQTVEVFGMIQGCVEELVDGIRTITLRLEKTVEEKEAVQNSIQNISAVSEEVAASTQEVTATLGEQAHVVQNLKEEVEKLEEDAQKLNASIERFKI